MRRGETHLMFHSIAENSVLSIEANEDRLNIIY